jgi:hypothetical protein
MWESPKPVGATAEVVSHLFSQEPTAVVATIETVGCITKAYNNHTLVFALSV